MQTVAQQARTRGFQAHLAIRGGLVQTDAEVQLTAVVEDQPVLAEPGEPIAQGQSPVYVDIVALAGVVADPRAIKTFTESTDGGVTFDGRVFTVIRFKDKVGDGVTWRWFCEAQRT